MSTHPRRVFVSVLTLVLFAGAAGAGDSVSQSTFGANFFSSSTPCKAKDLPDLEVIAPVPAIVDPFEDDIIPVFCNVWAQKKGNPVNNFRADFTSELVVVDHNTGMAEVFDIDSGSFKTNSDGFANLEFELPAPIFADGFESGDVSAWSYTRIDPKKKKRVTDVSVECGKNASRSNE